MPRPLSAEGGGATPASETIFVTHPAARTALAARRRTGWGKLRDLAAIALALIAGVAVAGAYATFRIWDVGQHDDRQRADAIIVLGAAQWNGTPSPVLAARLDHAIELYKSGLAAHMIVTGGKLPGDRVTEAESERDYAVAHGVPDTAILMESTGRTTLESMQNVRRIFEDHGFRSGLFVSDRTHMLRVLTMARDQGIEAHGSPTETSPSDATLGHTIDSTMHELGGLALYLLVEQSGAAPSPLHAKARAFEHRTLQTRARLLRYSVDPRNPHKSGAVSPPRTRIPS